MSGRKLMSSVTSLELAIVVEARLGEPGMIPQDPTSAIVPPMPWRKSAIRSSSTRAPTSPRRTFPKPDSLVKFLLPAELVHRLAHPGGPGFGPLGFFDPFDVEPPVAR